MEGVGSGGRGRCQSEVTRPIKQVGQERVSHPVLQ